MRSLLLLLSFLTFFSAVLPEPLQGKDLLLQLAVNAFGPKILRSGCRSKTDSKVKYYCNLDFDLFMTVDEITGTISALKEMFEGVGSVSRTIISKEKRVPTLKKLFTSKSMMTVKSVTNVISKDAHVWSVEYGAACESQGLPNRMKDCRIIRVKNAELYMGAKLSEGYVKVGQRPTDVSNPSSIPDTSSIFIDAMVGSGQTVFFPSTENGGQYKIGISYKIPTKGWFDPSEIDAALKEKM